jgi:cellobiose phosphorylase
VTYGHFSPDGREYVITRLPTPRAWENFISNPRYGLVVDATGAGYSVLPVFPGNRVTYSGPGQAYGKVFYLRDRESGEHWSLSWGPVRAGYDRFVCRHGIGYTIFEMARAGVESSLRVFVPADDPVEVWTARVSNRGGGPRRLTVFPCVEWHLAPYMRPWDNYRNYLEARWVAEEGLILATLYEPAFPGERYFGFAAVSPAASSYDCEHAVFMGEGTPAAPAAVGAGRCAKGDMPGDGRAIGAFAVDLELAPEEEQTVTLVIGCEGDPGERRRMRERYLDPERVEDEFARVGDHWESVFAQPRVETPEPRVDRMANMWLKANIVQLTRVLRENLRGYRDTLQDAFGIVAFDAECARATMENALAHQYGDGHAPRQIAYSRGPHDLRVYNDSPLWIVLALARYLKETGDLPFLDHPLPFFESDEAGTVFEHARRAVDWIGERRGWHGLVRIDRGDWCDAFDQIGVAGKGVSVWLSQAFHLALLEFSEICRVRGEARLAERYRQEAGELRARVERHAWDGEWYLAAISDGGRRLGARGERAMEIYLNSQSWAVIGQTGDPRRAATALDSADRKLSCPYGPLVIDPPFCEYDPEVGRMTVLRPGCGENGTVYVHAAVFYVLANLMARRPDRALEVLGQIAPMMEEQDPDITGAAPYAYVNSYVGPCYPAHEGRTLTNWYTSSASWTLYAITDWMLGVRPTYEGLLVDPCLPAEWERARLMRSWRGAEYEVTVTKPKGVVTGEVELTVDGEPFAGQPIPPHGDGRRHDISVAILPY